MSDDTRPAADLPRITRDEILAHDPLLGSVLRRLHPLSLGSTLLFAAATILPLAVMAVCAAAEGHLWLESMDCRPLPDQPDAVAQGISFLGDTMVWPFALLIPLTFALLNRAVNSVESLFRYPERVLSARWLRERPEEYEQVLARVRPIFAGLGRWRRLRAAAIAFGLALFLWNAATNVPSSSPLNPYSLPFSRVWTVAAHSESVPWCSPALRRLYQPGLSADSQRPVPVPKWDADPLGAPASWTAARLWVLLLGYTWLPLVGYKLATLVVGLRAFIREVARERRVLMVQPLSPDRAAGLSVLSTVAFSFIAPLVCFGVMLSMMFVKETAIPSWQDLAMLAAFAPLVLVVFFAPLLAVHGAMKSCKEQVLTECSLLFNELTARFFAQLQRAEVDLAEITKLETALRCLRENYERTQCMPVWPFAIARMLSLATVIALAALPIILQSVISHFLRQRP